MIEEHAQLKLDLQEQEYRLPTHWLLKKHGLIGYLRKTEVMARMILETGISGGRVLDIGCGDGRGTYELARILGESFVFQGIDFSERAIAFARLMEPKIDFRIQDAQKLNFEDNTFDLVVAREVIEHIPNDEIASFLSEIYRVLVPRGKALLTTPSKKRKVPPKHFQHFNAQQIQYILSESGFDLAKLAGFGWWPSFEGPYRYLISLPALWRIHVALGTREMPIDRADCIIALAAKC